MERLTAKSDVGNTGQQVPPQSPEQVMPDPIPRRPNRPIDREGEVGENRVSHPAFMAFF